MTEAQGTAVEHRPPARAGLAARTAALLRLARWLGPWADEGAAPAVQTERHVVEARTPEERPFEMVVLRPARRRAHGALLLVPGLHHAGPDDPRLARFAAIMAHSGVLVASPLLPDFARLRLDPRLITDTERAFDALLARPDRPPGRPGVMSISFGSLAALRLASHPRYAEQISGVLTFGGYAIWQNAMRFCLSGPDGTPLDPVNWPVLFIDCIDRLPGVTDAERLLAAWRGFVVDTWGRPWMKARDQYVPIAERWAESVAPADRTLFMQGCCAAPGGEALIERAIVDIGDSRDFLDARPHMRQGLRAPLFCVHGADDDVIPVTEAARIAEACGPDHPVKVLVTGLYGHSGQQRPTLRDSAREVRTLISILVAIRSITSGS